MPSVTTLIIAQRISTTKFADKILVLKDGSIIEEGNHEELVKAGGYYKELVDLQLGGKKEDEPNGYQEYLPSGRTAR